MGYTITITGSARDKKRVEDLVSQLKVIMPQLLGGDVTVNAQILDKSPNARV